MNYHIGRDGQQLGTFTKEQILAGLADGTLRSTDLAWTEGMTEWQPTSGLFPGTLGGPPPLASTPPLPPQVAGPWPAPGPVFTGSPRTEGLATASLVLGLLSFLLACLTALPAVICGHMALGKIKRSNGALTGSGMAVTGLVLGYLYIVLVPLIGIVAALALPAFNGVQEKAREMQSINNVRQVIIGLKSYAGDHQGKYPAAVKELVKAGIFDDEKALDTLLDYPQFQGWTSDKGYDYTGGTDADLGQKVILMSRSHALNGRRILGHNDGSVEIAVPAAGSAVP